MNYTLPKPGKDLDAFLAELTTLSIRYEIAISDDGTLYMMETEDFAFSYKVDDDCSLVRE